MTPDWKSIVAEATLKSVAALPPEERDEVSLNLVQPPATEGLRRWYLLLEK